MSGHLTQTLDTDGKNSFSENIYWYLMNIKIGLVKISQRIIKIELTLNYKIL